ncbi:uncharacterized protein G2W53_002387 [Senna tora]|uniref:Uncharacterized protein n=1 Tax=Senna tora TaxID=362788 RepID=A0A834XKH5_9FABA|nr:uncharacterized protein G2W53_002387 [Senna tora]
MGVAHVDFVWSEEEGKLEFNLGEETGKST